MKPSESLSQIEAAIGDLTQGLRHVERELALSDYDTTEATRVEIGEARKCLGWAIANVARAKERLRP